MTARKTTIPDWKKKYIRINHKEQTVSEMAEALEISDCWIRSFCKNEKIKAKPSEFHKKNRQPGTVIKGHPYVPRYIQDEVKKERPRGVYSNPNYSEQYL